MASRTACMAPYVPRTGDGYPSPASIFRLPHAMASQSDDSRSWLTHVFAGATGSRRYSRRWPLTRTLGAMDPDRDSEPTRTDAAADVDEIG
jgi:hypothetical protein